MTSAEARRLVGEAIGDARENLSDKREWAREESREDDIPGIEAADASYAELEQAIARREVVIAGVRHG